MPCDVFLASLFIDSDVIRKSNDYHVTVELSGRYTRGQVVIDHLFQEKANCTIVELLDEELIRKMLLYTAGHKKVQ
jgi:inosine-uridine nucleoside N-ribohydrolase